MGTKMAVIYQDLTLSISLIISSKYCWIGCLNYFLTLSMMNLACYAKLFLSYFSVFFTVRPTMYLIAKIRTYFTYHSCWDILDVVEVVHFYWLVEAVLALPVKSRILLDSFFDLGFQLLLVLRLTYWSEFGLDFYLIKFIVHHWKLLYS